MLPSSDLKSLPEDLDTSDWRCQLLDLFKLVFVMQEIPVICYRLELVTCYYKE